MRGGRELLDGVAAGPEVCCSARHAYAEIWVLLWHKVRDIGLENLTFVKVKAHVDPASQPSGSNARRDAVGNQWAHKCAKRGAGLHSVPRFAADQLRRARSVTASLAGVLPQICCVRCSMCRSVQRACPRVV